MSIDKKALDEALDIAQKASTVTTLSYEEVIRIYCKEATKSSEQPDEMSFDEWAKNRPSLSSHSARAEAKYIWDAALATKREIEQPDECPQCKGEGEYFHDGEAQECFACKPHRKLKLESQQPVELPRCPFEVWECKSCKGIYRPPGVTECDCSPGEEPQFNKYLMDTTYKREFSDQDAETTLKIANAAIKRNGVLKDALQKIAKQKLHAEQDGYEGGYTEPDTNAFIYTSDWDMAQDEVLEEVRNMAKQALSKIEGGK